MRTLDTKSENLISELVKLENRGEYEEALLLLETIWTDKTAFPNVDGLPPRVAADIILRCGVLIGYLGHNKQLPNSQERSKNLLAEAHRRFLDIYDIEKIAECESYLALTYQRTGEFEEAETWVEESLSRKTILSSLARLRSFVIKSAVFMLSGRHEENLEFCKEHESYILEFGDYFLKGRFYTNYGVSLKTLGQTAEALKKHRFAKRFHEKSRHTVFLGTVENNLAQLYKELNRFVEAHRSIDNAAKVFRTISDRTREGFSYDTKAQIYYAEGKYDDGLKTIEKAVRILKKGENKAYLVEAYTTKSKMLVAVDDIAAAVICISGALTIATTHISAEAAKKLAEEFEDGIRERKLSTAKSVLVEKELGGGKELELILPSSISHYQEYQAVWIKNTHLEEAGLNKDCLAIVVEEEIEKGNLVAVSEIKDGSVSCGFYDSDFGIVCLEGINSAPQIFNEQEIDILGKIVGVSESSKPVGGKMLIKSLV